MSELKGQGEAGELVGSGSFRVDRSRALDKLATFQLDDPAEAVLALIRCAVASGAGSIRLSFKRSMEIRFDGRPLASSELGDPFACLFDETAAIDRRSRQLAVGILGALRASPSGVALIGGPSGARRELALESAEHFTSTPSGEPGSDTVIRAGNGLSAGAAGRVRGFCYLSPIPIWIGEQEVPRSRRREHRPGVYFEADGRYGWVTVPFDPERPSSMRLYALGVGAWNGEIEHPGEAVTGFVNDDLFDLDASQRGVVRNERFESMVKSLAAASDQLLTEMAEHLRRSLPVTVCLVDSPRFAAAWRLANVSAVRPAHSGLFGRIVGAIDRLKGSDPVRFKESRDRVYFDADCARWLRRAAIRRGQRLPEDRALSTAPLFVGTTIGHAWSMEEIAKELRRAGRIVGSRAVALAKAPDGMIWCSTPGELKDLRQLVPKGLELA